MTDSQKIIKFLMKNGSSTSKDIFEGTGLDSANARLKTAIKNGEVEIKKAIRGDDGKIVNLYCLGEFEDGTEEEKIASLKSNCRFVKAKQGMAPAIPPEMLVFVNPFNISQERRA